MFLDQGRDTGESYELVRLYCPGAIGVFNYKLVLAFVELKLLAEREAFSCTQGLKDI
jgi:hypothetical protein